MFYRVFFFFFFNDTATTEIYTLSLHDALPISDSGRPWFRMSSREAPPPACTARPRIHRRDSGARRGVRQRATCRLAPRTDPIALGTGDGGPARGYGWRGPSRAPHRAGLQGRGAAAGRGR